MLGRYHTPDGKVLYSVKRGLSNTPLNTNNPLGLAGHISRGNVYEHLPSGNHILDHELLWEHIHDRRMELEVFCRWRSLRVPRTCLADIGKDLEVNEASILHTLQQEVMQMERRLHRFHKIEAAKRHSISKDFTVEQSLTDPMLISDPNLSNFTESSNDDFQRYIPDCLMHNNILRCCMVYD